jgi:hypothetical protein
MSRQLHINQDVIAGLMFVVIGAFFLWFGRGYEVGTSLRMGPGYLPNLLGWLLVALGALVASKGALAAGLKIDSWALRPLILVPAAFLLFAFTIERFGLIAAALVSMICAAASSREFRVKEQVMVAAASAIGAAWLFIYELQLPMRYWPPFVDALGWF